MRKLVPIVIAALLTLCLVIVSSMSATLGGASGYAAKNLCSGHFISGFSGDTIMDEALIGASPLLGLFTYTIHDDQRRVDTHLKGFFHRRAVYADAATGCTLLTSDQDVLQRPVIDPRAKAEPGTFTPASLSDKQDGAIKVAIDAAFATSEHGPRYTKAVAILHKGHLVAERYVEGVGPDTPLIGWSMNKSIVGLVAGIAVKDELITLQQKAPVATWQEESSDPRSAVTIDQLLRMSSGLTFNEYYGTSSDVTYMLSNAGDAGDFAASFPLEAEPDVKWSYSSGTTNIVSKILKNAVGGTLKDHYVYMQSRLFEPLGITTAIMETDADGTFIGSSYGYASARDWARLGQLCLQDGVWEGERILPEGWMTYVTTPTKTNPQNNYGAHFWLNRQPTDETKPLPFPGVPEDAYTFSGFQGQFVMVIPSRELVIVRLGFTGHMDDGMGDLAAAVVEALR